VDLPAVVDKVFRRGAAGVGRRIVRSLWSRLGLALDVSAAEPLCRLSRDQRERS